MRRFSERVLILTKSLDLPAHQCAILKYLTGSSNQAADQASRNAAQCQDSPLPGLLVDQRQGDPSFRQLDPASLESITEGNEAMPLGDRDYWRRQQLECRDLKLLAHHLKFATTPQKNSHKVRLKRYLDQRNGISLSPDNVLLAHPSKPLQANKVRRSREGQDDTDCHLPSTVGMPQSLPFKELLRRHYFVLELDKAVGEYVDSCVSCTPPMTGSMRQLQCQQYHCRQLLENTLPQTSSEETNRRFCN